MDLSAKPRYLKVQVKSSINAIVSLVLRSATRQCGTFDADRPRQNRSSRSLFRRRFPTHKHLILEVPRIQVKAPQPPRSTSWALLSASALLHFRLTFILLCLPFVSQALLFATGRAIVHEFTIHLLGIVHISRVHATKAGK